MLEKLLKFIFNFEITCNNYFNWDCTKSWHLTIFQIIAIDWRGCKTQKSKFPYAFKAFMRIYFKCIGSLNFGVGRQNSTWFRIRNEEIYSMYIRLKNKNSSPF